jgi:hypothetical protein
MSWFGKKIECEVIGTNGKPKKIRISEKEFNLLVTEGKVRVLNTPEALSSLQEYYTHHYKFLISLQPHYQEAASITIYRLWQAFIESYPDIRLFRNADNSKQIDYLRKVGKFIESMLFDEIASRGAVLFQLYLVAVIRNDKQMIALIADALEPFNKAGYERLRLVGEL